MTSPLRSRGALRSAVAAVALGLTAASSLPAWSAGPQLYASGPSEDAAYVRFVNATGEALDIQATGEVSQSGQLHLETARPASAFMGVKPGAALRGRARQGGNSLALAPVAKAGELVSVIVWSGPDGKLGATVISELPKNFNGLKASIALFNADTACAAAGLTSSDAHTLLFENAGPGVLQRRPINPVALTAQANCARAAVGHALDLGTLEAGQRYSVFLVPERRARRAFWARDEMAQ